MRLAHSFFSEAQTMLKCYIQIRQTIIHGTLVYAYICVCVRERESERERN